MAVTEGQIIEKRGLNCLRKASAAASTTLYGGTLAFINATGFDDDDTNTGANTFGGVVRETTRSQRLLPTIPISVNALSSFRQLSCGFS